MTSSSDFSPMYASTSSINCERTRAVKSKHSSLRQWFILVSFLLVVVGVQSIKSNKISNRKSQPSSTRGTRRPLPRARANSSSVTHPSRVPLPWARPYPPPPSPWFDRSRPPATSNGALVFASLHSWKARVQSLVLLFVLLQITNLRGDRIRVNTARRDDDFEHAV